MTDDYRSIQCNNATTSSRYVKNKVRHTKYINGALSPFNFIVRFLIEQFSRFMNLYFLVIAILQLNPSLTPVNPITTWVPLLLTLSIAGVKEVIDDLSRWRQDRRTNLRRYLVSNGQSFSMVLSQDIKVGNIIHIRENEEIPADVVVLKSSEKGGKCFVNTVNIDGEADLKPKIACNVTNQLSVPEVARFQGVLTIPHPSPDFGSFDSVLTIDKNKYTLSSNNLLLQATSLAATSDVYGVVVYVGNKTKYGLSKKKAPTKWTRIDRKINRFTLCIWSGQLLLAFTLGIAGNFSDYSNHWYLFPNKVINVLLLPEWAVIPLRFLLLCSLLIPISLKVTLDVAKLIYAKFIEVDEKMVCPRSGGAIARSTAISEDLGQIEYVFADKTGTLTENKMLFHSAAVGSSVFSSNVTSKSTLPMSEVHVAPNGPYFIRALALCNSVDTLYNGSARMPLYRAASPDEKALVLATKDMGAVLMKRSEEQVGLLVSSKLAQNNETLEDYHVLAVLPFSSDRKRMGVLLRKKNSSDTVPNSGDCLFLIKGADDVLIPMCNQTSDSIDISRNLDKFAAKGLRTLAVAYRHVSAQEANKFLQILEEASTSMSNRDGKVEQAYKLLEHSLTLAGATAIEDSLQSEVSSTISYLRKAGVKVWMLTGDKSSTALQVGISTHLVSQNDNVSAKDSVFLLSAVSDASTLSSELKKISSLLNDGRNVTKSLVLTGISVPPLLSPSLLPLFLKVTDKMESVICCRLTPTQKADIVTTHRNYKKAVCLSIGDGGNDVAQILAANVGVGIIGREGLAAAGAADYAIGQFRFLKRLMTIHGRGSLRKTAFITLFSFWKSMVLAFQQLSFSTLTMFSGSSFFDTFALSTWNIIFTSFPVLMYVLDRDVEAEVIASNANVYKSTLRNDVMSVKIFASWVLRAFWQAIVCFAVSLLSFGPGYAHPSKGIPSDYYAVPIVSFTSAMVIHTVTMVTESNLITGLNAFFIFGSMAILPLSLALFSFVPTSDLFDVQIRLFKDPIYYFSVIVTSILAMLPVLFFQWRKFLVSKFKSSEKI
ncbi:hypothetical protein P9112_008987 [Eukaryota sp. TZLM1-RC]